MKTITAWYCRVASKPSSQRFEPPHSSTCLWSEPGV